MMGDYVWVIVLEEESKAHARKSRFHLHFFNYSKFLLKIQCYSEFFYFGYSNHYRVYSKSRESRSLIEVGWECPKCNETSWLY